MKVAVIFDHFGPYHMARLHAAASHVRLQPIELFGKTTEYEWENINEPLRTTILEEDGAGSPSFKKLSRELHRVLSAQQPDAVAINGWSHKGALSALYWCRKNRVPAIVMSESCEEDEVRVGWKEYIKKKLVGLYASGLVGGSRHVAYLKGLGMDDKNIFTGYDVVDNGYFQTAVNIIRKNKERPKGMPTLPEHFFLVSSRFIPKKNLPFIIRAFAGYRNEIKDKKFDLVILGDGVMRSQLLQQVREAGLEDSVHMPGFIQYDELPGYYAFAGALIHASTSEQWGLVVNEAMASGLPVIVSEKCGCAPDLVKNGFNGFTFDPFDEAALKNIMLKISEPSCNLEAMGIRSRDLIRNWQPSSFGKGLEKAAEMAIHAKQKHFSLLDRMVIKSLIHARN